MTWHDKKKFPCQFFFFFPFSCWSLCPLKSETRSREAQWGGSQGEGGEAECRVLCLEERLRCKGCAWSICPRDPEPGGPAWIHTKDAMRSLVIIFFAGFHFCTYFWWPSWHHQHTPTHDLKTPSFGEVAIFLGRSFPRKPIGKSLHISIWTFFLLWLQCLTTRCHCSFLPGTKADLNIIKQGHSANANHKIHTR